LLVTLGSFTNQALDFARSKSSIHLLDGEALVRLVMDHYEGLDPKFRSLIPLRRAYVPSPPTEAGGA